MHVSIEYSPEDATTIYQSVMAILNKMADKGMKEKGRPVAAIVALAGEPSA